MSRPRFYHNPSCSKSRETKKLLDERGLDYETVLYLESPPSATELDRILKRLDRQPIDLIRTKEKLFTELGLARDDERSRKDWIAIMVANPRLIERPILVNGDRAAVGRPPESVLEIL